MEPTETSAAGVVGRIGDRLMIELQSIADFVRLIA